MISEVNWKPLKMQVVKTAEAMGHELGSFRETRKRPPFRVAACKKCHGLCWMSFTPPRRMRAGGRLLKFRCGTPEAIGLK